MRIWRFDILAKFGKIKSAKIRTAKVGTYSRPVNRLHISAYARASERACVQG